MPRVVIPLRKEEILRRYFEREKNSTLAVPFMYAVLQKRKEYIRSITPIIIGSRTGIDLQWKRGPFEHNWFDNDGIHLNHSNSGKRTCSFEDMLSHNGIKIDTWWWIDFHMDVLNPHNDPYYGDGRNVLTKSMTTKELNPPRRVNMFGEVPYI